ncbi:arsenate reductase family protein [Autumnicola psychrophila]|uniref:ArsC/Spx/MgsR family protein n=1 Tax=Autumnicola psychrophila TaxID=3075592 RepID=A0ABU3DNK9_9FLAO|nr:ArsC/Spx/MgsR family protein [Zunongwangia sp. F225]MDT0685281.1 ArsC/Spx/MgsR family protein [Zunongwangia sp. F225]
MKKIHHLSTCDTCKRILKELDLPSSFILQDIKTEKITEKQLEEMQELSGSYESLFSKRARLYKEKDLKNKDLDENQYKNLILEHYTFLKRPVIINNDKIFIGNSRKTVEAAKASIHE